MIDHRSYTHNLNSWEIKAWKKNSGLNGIRSHNLCNTGAVLYYWLTYQDLWELVTLWVRNTTVDDEEYIMIICKIIYLNCGERYEDMIIAVIYAIQVVVKLKSEESKSICDEW